MHVPGAARVDAPLVVGSIAFGIGWGLVGFCPGPALTALAVGRYPTLLFVAAMVAGMAVFEVIQRLGPWIRRQTPRRARPGGNPY